MYVYICTCTHYVHAHVCVSMDVSVCLYAAHDVCICGVRACMHPCKVHVGVCVCVQPCMQACIMHVVYAVFMSLYACL